MYLGIDCPICDRRRLLVDEIGVQCEKCEYEWAEQQAVAEAYKQKAARKVQEACVEIADEVAGKEDGYAAGACYDVAKRIRALDIKKLLEEG